jgi:hypothetical protein
MSKEKRASIIRANSLLAVLLLSACSSASGSGSASKPIAIRYLDDSAEGAEIGYSYIAVGKSAPLPTNYEDTTWDGSSRSGALPSKIGGYWAFKDFEGTYADGTKVDLTDVKADCTVKAVFVEKQYQWTFNYWNSGRNMSVDATLDFDGATLPSFPSAVDPNPSWYQVSNFSGFSFNKDAGSPKAVFNSSSLLHFESGEGDPSTVSAVGTLYYSLALTNFNRTYPVWFSNGASWISLGSLKEGLKVRLDAAYAKTLKNFTISFYPSQADADAGSNKRSETLSFVYGSILTVDASDPANVKFSALAQGATTPMELTLTYTGSLAHWQGIYTGAEGVDAATDRYLNGGEILKDQSQLFENCAFYPVA